MSSPELSLSEHLTRFTLAYPRNLAVGSICLDAYAKAYDLKPLEGFIPGDIDVCTNEETYDELRKQGWQDGPYCLSPTLRDTDSKGKHVFDVGIIAAGLTYDRLIRRAIHVEGNNYMDPFYLLQWKRQLNRQKDQAHIAYIEDHVLEPWVASQLEKPSIYDVRMTSIESKIA